MRGFGLVGYPLTHSFSKRYFTDKFFKEHIEDCYYENFPLTGIEGIRELVRSRKELDGLNVTIPHKERVMHYLDKVNEEAASIGAVNTIKIIRDADSFYLEGYNTDIYGFYMSLKPFLKHHHKKALILGTGGASKAVAWVLKNSGISFLYVSRNPRLSNQISYKDLKESIVRDHLLIINTSPLGTYPDTDTLPDIPYDFLSPAHLLYDLVYNPRETLFLSKGRNMGALTVNGLSMLYLQAEKSWEIWNS